ncbi:hypothetical protein NUW58_g1866 [Xylaria curta]|uniref:Uncharacterized protein n=1 Tax=Xylaria curta TaxID=42375 RepID=A0ACC1PK23_9PEZI|nr:hypothetical protein NUW58_g1866 [Xylaria curta]
MIAARLEDDVAESKGKVFRHVASDINLDSRPTMFRDNTHSVTSVALCSPFIYLVTKDSQLIKYRLQPPADEQYKQTTRRKPKKQAPPRKRPQRVASVKGRHSKAGDKNFKGHVGQILCVAASDDGKYVVTGGDDKRIVVWDSSLKPLRVFTHHRDAVTGVVFRRNSPQMYSCSKDRTIRVWNCDALAFVESLFGHADSALDVDALALERLVSVGARDRTVRRKSHFATRLLVLKRFRGPHLFWKVADETQLVFRASSGTGDKKRQIDLGVDPNSLAATGSLDRVAYIDESHFITGWTLSKKKPLDTIRVWKFDEKDKKLESVGILGQPSKEIAMNGPVNEISTDVMDIRNEDEEDKRLSAVGANPYQIKGVVNDIAIISRGKTGDSETFSVVCAIGKEHRLGRWGPNIKGAKNGAVVFELQKKSRKGGVGSGANGIEKAATE